MGCFHSDTGIGRLAGQLYLRLHHSQGVPVGIAYYLLYGLLGILVPGYLVSSLEEAYQEIKIFYDLIATCV